MHHLFVLLCVICLKELFPIFKCRNHNCTCWGNFKYSRYNSSEQTSNTVGFVYSFHCILYICCSLSSFSIWEKLQLRMRTTWNKSYCSISKKSKWQQSSHLPVYISFSPNSICWCVFTTSNGKVMNAAICKLIFIILVGLKL